MKYMAHLAAATAADVSHRAGWGDSGAMRLWGTGQTRSLAIRLDMPKRGRRIIRSRWNRDRWNRDRWNRDK
jgi:hypothetical protein